ncbi:MAG TPA: hypothetical protein VG871_06780 [Vicinamibacterales bacterium]|nr:hypothetical protein [Vicinamibacterales bacterium]
MESQPLAHVPVVAGPAYAENIQRLPSKFTATLQADADNRVSLTAVSVHAGGGKVGYLPPEIARHYFEALKANGPLEAPGRRSPLSAHEDTGVDLLLDLTAIPRAD